ncbi:hypothetical protein [Desulfurispora thermophila]|uniref:hypothetical protein n=1 Tax=Desulfurispora thermophila TaxID=265470 RepID=UPI0012E9CF22|nr:hypothetical protein [Desulfurispora thermophila]
MPSTRKRAEWLLANFPGHWRRLQEEREAAEATSLQAIRLDAGSHSKGTYSDRTAKTALSLVELAAREWELDLVRQWIDHSMPAEARPLLLAVWRSRQWGWRWISRELHQSPHLCRTEWDTLVAQLADWLKGGCGSGLAGAGHGTGGLAVQVGGPAAGRSGPQGEFSPGAGWANV